MPVEASGFLSAKPISLDPLSELADCRRHNGRHLSILVSATLDFPCLGVTVEAFFLEELTEGFPAELIVDSAKPDASGWGRGRDSSS